MLVRTALQALDLDGDWDATTHDLQMAAMLAETDGADANNDDEKPTWDDDIDVDHIVPWNEEKAQHTSPGLDAKERKKEKKKEKKKARDVDMDGVDVDEMDADALQDGENKWDEVEWDGTEDMRKRVLDQYMEELYELEFNDMVRLLSSLLACSLTVRSGRRHANALPLQHDGEKLIRADTHRDPTRGRQGSERVRGFEKARSVSQTARHVGCKTRRAAARVQEETFGPRGWCRRRCQRGRAPEQQSKEEEGKEGTHARKGCACTTGG